MNKILITFVFILALTPCIALSMQSPSPKEETEAFTQQAKKDDDQDKDQASESQDAADAFSSEESESDEDDDAELLVQNINIRVAQLQKHLDHIVATTPADEIKKLAIVLDLDDTCLCSPEAYKLLIQNPESPLFDADEVDKEYWPYPITPVLFLFNWAIDAGFKIFFLTARPDKNPLDPDLDVTHLHKKQIKAAAFGKIDNKKEFLICMPVKKYQEVTLPENKDTCDAIIGAWKHAQHDEIEKKYGCKIVAVLDDQPANINREKPGHLRIPSPGEPQLTPQKPKTVKTRPTAPEMV